MRVVLAVFIFMAMVFSLSAYDFDGEWHAKFELNEKYEEGVVLAKVEIKDDVIYIKGEEKEFKVIDNFYIIYDGKKYYYSTNTNFFVLYSLKEDYQFNRILFLKPIKGWKINRKEGVTYDYRSIGFKSFSVK